MKLILILTTLSFHFNTCFATDLTGTQALDLVGSALIQKNTLYVPAGEKSLPLGENCILKLTKPQKQQSFLFSSPTPITITEIVSTRSQLGHHKTKASYRFILDSTKFRFLECQAIERRDEKMNAQMLQDLIDDLFDISLN